MGLNELVFSQEVVIYPNPTSSIVHINSNLKIESISSVDFLGKTSLVNFNSNNTIDVSNLPKGVYLLQIETDKGLINKKIICLSGTLPQNH